MSKTAIVPNTEDHDHSLSIVCKEWHLLPFEVISLEI